jgi:hypothetical protein
VGKLVKCEGNLVGPRFVIKENPVTDFDPSKRSTGCSHLLCAECHETVHATVRGKVRVYGCACHRYETSSVERVQTNEDHPGCHAPWSCGGHQAAKAPFAIDGFVFRGGPIDPKVFAHALRVNPDRPLVWFWKVEERLSGTTLGRGVGRAAWAALLDRDPRVRSLALLMVPWDSRDPPARVAAAASRLFRLLSRHEDAFAGAFTVPDRFDAPPRPGETLRDRALLTLLHMSLFAPPPPKLRERLRAHLLEPGKARAREIGWMFDVDRDWLIEHSGALAQATPRCEGPIVDAIRLAPRPGDDILESLIERLDPEVRRRGALRARLPFEPLWRWLAKHEPRWVDAHFASFAKRDICAFYWLLPELTAHGAPLSAKTLALLRARARDITVSAPIRDALSLYPRK